MSDDVPRPKTIRIGKLELPRKALYAAIVVALYVAGAAVAVGYLHAGNRPAAPGSHGTPQAEASGDATRRCWDGSGVEGRERCSTDYDANVLFWAFGIDANEAKCERSKSYAWSDVGVTCDYKGTDLRMAIWRTAHWRDQRLVEYGKASPAGRGLILQAPGEAGRTLVRYDSDRALLYASVKAKDSAVLDRLMPKFKSRTELVNGTKVTGS